MKRFVSCVGLPGFFSSILAIVLVAVAGLMLSCSKAAVEPQPEAPRTSAIKVEVRANGPIVITTSAAEFQILPSGFLQATLLKDGKRLTLDDPGAASGNGITHGGKELQFVPDLASAKVSDAAGKLGSGKRVEISSHPAAAGAAIERTAVVESYDDFPNLAFVSVQYKNAGTADFQLDQATVQQHRFNAKLVDAKLQPYDMWSYQGSSYDWGKDDVQKLTRVSSQPNLMGEAIKGGYGGGIPVVAFWTASVGEAIGHVETLPWTLSIPVKVEADGRVKTDVSPPGEYGAQAGRKLLDAPHLCRGLQRRLLRAAAHVVERAAERGMGNSEAVERGL